MLATETTNHVYSYNPSFPDDVRMALWSREFDARSIGTWNIPGSPRENLALRTVMECPAIVWC